MALHRCIIMKLIIEMKFLLEGKINDTNELCPYAY